MFKARPSRAVNRMATVLQTLQAHSERCRGPLTFGGAPLEFARILPIVAIVQSATQAFVQS